MSHLAVDSILSAKLYNRGKRWSTGRNLPNIRVDIAKAVNFFESIKPCFLVPLLWMAPSPDGTLVAYEYGLLQEDNLMLGVVPRPAGAMRRPKYRPRRGDSSTRDFCCLRALCGDRRSRLAQGQGLRGRGRVCTWCQACACCSGCPANPSTSSKVVMCCSPAGILVEVRQKKMDAGLQPECADGHATKTRQTTGGTVAHYHATTEDGIDAFNDKEVAPLYTRAMWSAAKLGEFWAMAHGGKLVDPVV